MPYSTVISVHMKLNMDVLLEKMWEYLGMVMLVAAAVGSACLFGCAYFRPVSWLPSVTVMCPGSCVHQEARLTARLLRTDCVDARPLRLYNRGSLSTGATSLLLCCVDPPILEWRCCSYRR